MTKFQKRCDNFLIFLLMGLFVQKIPAFAFPAHMLAFIDLNAKFYKRVCKTWIVSCAYMVKGFSGIMRK